VVFKCNYLFNCRLEFKNVVLREILGGEMEKLKGGWRKCNGLWENGICGACETVRGIENYGQNIV
jgi:hypothetical protein